MVINFVIIRIILANGVSEHELQSKRDRKQVAN